MVEAVRDENMWNLILTNFITFSGSSKWEVLMKATVNLQPRALKMCRRKRARKRVAFDDFATCRHKMRNNVIIVKNTWHTHRGMRRGKIVFNFLLLLLLRYESICDSLKKDYFHSHIACDTDYICFSLFWLHKKFSFIAL